jgi:hypothetical protein
VTDPRPTPAPASATTPTPAPLRARRPSGPRAGLATVTHLAPPGDHRETVPLASVQGTLALDLALDLDLHPAREAPRPPELRVLPGDGATEHQELHAWAARFAQATVEALGGDRPLSQLLRLTTTRVYADLDRRVRILGRPTPGPRRPRAVRPQVRSVHVSRPGPECAEVSVHVRYGQRSRAIAARLELREGRWVCSALQLG